MPIAAGTSMTQRTVHITPVRLHVLVEVLPICGRNLAKILVQKRIIFVAIVLVEDRNAVTHSLVLLVVAPILYLEVVHIWREGVVIDLAHVDEASTWVGLGHGLHVVVFDTLLHTVTRVMLVWVRPTRRRPKMLQFVAVLVAAGTRNMARAFVVFVAYGDTLVFAKAGGQDGRSVTEVVAKGVDAEGS
ncbi:hypothetical protein K458DRAFT_137126 [Lentithecium fluviatile CBS 122367]|uniref:Uncharacterized protein n=1 Tax=Lentithecium fluviatile CBS 122367 TaxID=1168545 RepID=A0A6G1IKE8_9PLEO|nr:hypothetical protein K458DRAFT_137126 [Lentithecium fluviatile CBS 122367]